MSIESSGTNDPAQLHKEALYDVEMAIARLWPLQCKLTKDGRMQNNVLAVDKARDILEGIRETLESRLYREIRYKEVYKE